MCALLSPLPSFGLPLEDSMSHQYNQVYRETLTADQSFSNFHPYQLQALQPDCSTSFDANGGDRSMVKKLYHNASERDRRKRINDLYSTLRSLLPAADQTKKLSIPTTVSRVLKYIPELQQQVEKLIQEKEELLSRLNSCNEKKRKSASTSTCVSVSRLSEREVMIQISTYKIHRSPFSKILLHLEGVAFLLSMFLHLNPPEEEFSTICIYRGDRSYKLKGDVLSEKISSMFP